MGGLAVNGDHDPVGCRRPGNNGAFGRGVEGIAIARFQQRWGQCLGAAQADFLTGGEEQFQWAVQYTFLLEYRKQFRHRSYTGFIICSKYGFTLAGENIIFSNDLNTLGGTHSVHMTGEQ